MTLKNYEYFKVSSNKQKTKPILSTSSTLVKNPILKKTQEVQTNIPNLISTSSNVDTKKKNKPINDQITDKLIDGDVSTKLKDVSALIIKIPTNESPIKSTEDIITNTSTNILSNKKIQTNESIIKSTEDMITNISTNFLSNINNSNKIISALLTLTGLPGQILARLLYNKGSIDKAYLLLLAKPPYSIIPSICMYLGLISDGENPIDKTSIIGTILLLILPIKNY